MELANHPGTHLGGILPGLGSEGIRRHEIVAAPSEAVGTARSRDVPVLDDGNLDLHVVRIFPRSIGLVLGGVLHQIAFHVTTVPGRGPARTIRAPSWCRRFANCGNRHGLSWGPCLDIAPHEPKGPSSVPNRELPFFRRIDPPDGDQDGTRDKSGPEAS